VEAEADILKQRKVEAQTAKRGDKLSSNFHITQTIKRLKESDRSGSRIEGWKKYGDRYRSLLMFDLSTNDNYQTYGQAYGDIQLGQLSKNVFENKQTICGQLYGCNNYTKQTTDDIQNFQYYQTVHPATECGRCRETARDLCLEWSKYAAEIVPSKHSAGTVKPSSLWDMFHNVCSDISLRHPSDTRDEIQEACESIFEDFGGPITDHMAKMVKYKTDRDTVGRDQMQCLPFERAMCHDIAKQCKVQDFKPLEDQTKRPENNTEL